MTIAQVVKNAHWEYFDVSVAYLVGAGTFDSATVTFDEPGSILGLTIAGQDTPTNTAPQSIGHVRIIFNGGGANYAYGLFVTNFVVRGYKLASADAATIHYVVGFLLANK